MYDSPRPGQTTGESPISSSIGAISYGRF
jgi:hypothetical protein